MAHTSDNRGHLRVPSSAHLGLGFMVLRQDSDQNEFDKTAAKVPDFHRKFDRKDVRRVLFNPAYVGNFHIGQFSWPPLD